MHAHFNRSAFSLVELSIVLVILGLLTGGILAGQSLIRAAELRSVTTEYSRYIAAVQSFRDKYMGIPGDFTNGTRFWGRHANQAWCVTNSAAAVNSTTGTCDGNNDGSYSSGGTLAETGESFQFWRQLALAGLIEGSYTGLNGATQAVEAGINVPRSKINNAIWHNEACCAGGGANFFTNGGYGINFRLAQAASMAAVITPEEAWNIDTKMDDGRPGYGKVIGNGWSGCTTATSWTDNANAEYRLTSTSIACAPNFRQAF